MKTIRMELAAATTAQRAADALTTQTGYRAWWNAVAEIDAAPGGEARLRFVKDGVPIAMRFRVEAPGAGEAARWTCVANDAAEWVGTTLSWRVTGRDAGVVIALEHAGWAAEPPDAVRGGWRYFLDSLEAYLTTGTGKPW